MIKKAEILKNQLDELNSKIIKIQNDIEFVSKMLEETENTLDELQKSDEKKRNLYHRQIYDEVIFMTSEDIKYIIKCIRQDTISNIDKMHIEGLLLAELERVEWLKQFQPK